jgi:hypothetical protein
MLIVCAALWILALLMEAGVLHRQDAWVGPFRTEAPGSPLLILTMGQSRPLPQLTDTGGDDPQNPSRSNIAVSVAGEPWEVGHTQHAELRAGKTHAFSHWGDQLYLVLPPNLENGPQLAITTDYTLQPRPWVTKTLLLAVAMLGALRLVLAIAAGGSQAFVRPLKAIGRVVSKPIVVGALIDPLRRLLTVMLMVCAGLWLLVLLMEAGVLHRQDAWAGPFPSAAPGSPVVELRMGESRPLPSLTDTGGDDMENPYRSNIAVTVADERWEVGHTQHDELRAGKTRAFSHWGDWLYLVVPPELENGPQLVITADYTLQPRPWVSRTLLLALALLGALRFRVAIVEGKSQGFVRRLQATQKAACIAGVVLAGALTAYAVVIVYGWIAGYETILFTKK